MGRLRKVSHKDISVVSSIESADSLNGPFKPNEFAEDGSNAMSLDLSSDDGGFDKALFNFYVNHELQCNLAQNYSVLCPQYYSVIYPRISLQSPCFLFIIAV